LANLEAQLRQRDVAAFIVEPIQGRAVTPAPEGYLQEAAALCRRYGTLFVVDEVQTGLGRTGRWFALERWELKPDVVLVGKALSGGFMPVAAMVTTREIYDKAVGTLERSYVHQSTFGRNRLSMAAGLATLRVIDRDRLVEHAAHVGARLFDGLVELASRHEMVKEVRGAGLMLGIELCAPRSRMGRLNWRLIHMASEGLFPQLIVIPLHRDHGVITMAAGKNDVIKLLPPLTLSEGEADSFLSALDAVLAECHRSSSTNWSIVRDIASSTIRNRSRAEERHEPRRVPAGNHRNPTRTETCLITGASGFIGGHLAERLVGQGLPVRCLVRPTSDLSLLETLGVEIAVGDLVDADSVARAARGCRYVLHCGALVSDWATVGEIKRINVEGTRNVVSAAVDACVERFVHFSSTDVYGYPGGHGIDETYVATRFRNWYSQTKFAAETEVRRAARAQRLEAVILRPATVYGPRSTDVVGEIARAIRGGNMLLVDGGRAIAGLCYVGNLIDAAALALVHDAAPGNAFNVTDGLDVTWKEFTSGLAQGLGRPDVRRSLPYWAAKGIGFSLEHGYRLLRTATRLSLPPLLSRQAVHVMGHNQDFSNRKARELLGWEPRVDYDSGLVATLDWLHGALSQDS
jgi:nucleoside-diphosphate-sugar epimerase